MSFQSKIINLAQRSHGAQRNNQKSKIDSVRIGGFTKQSFIDWEGKTAAVIFTKGCNFRCGYCHNPSLVLSKLMDKEPDIPENEVIAYLESRKDWLDGVVITGGEPTIHAGLEDFMIRIKNTGLPVKLDTNGSNPEVLTKLIEKSFVDYIAMDIKTKLIHERYAEITNSRDELLTDKIRRSLHILRQSGIGYQLRTTVIPEQHTKETISSLKKEFIGENYVLQDFRERDTIENQGK